MNIDKEELATIIATLRDKDNYKEFEQGYFRKVPKISGYYYELKKMNILDEYRIAIIVNTNTNNLYPKEDTVVDNYTFLVYNAESFEDYTKQIVMVAHKLANTIEELYKRVQEERDNDLPYGYVRDEEGKVQVDSIKANEVRKIYKMYIETQSMKKIAKELKTNFSHVRDILRDDRYDEMQPRIISTSTWKQVEAIAKANQKNGVTKADTSRVAQLKKEMAQVTRG